MRYFLLSSLLLLFLGDAAPAQEAPPASRVLDSANALDEHRRETLSRQLRGTASEQDIFIYFVTADRPPDGLLVGNWALELRRAWIPEGLGAILVYAQSDKRLSVSATEMFDQISGTGNLIDIIHAAEKALRQGTPQNIALREAALRLDYELRKAQEAHLAKREQIKQGLTAGVGALLLLFVCLCFWAIRRLRYHNFFDKAYTFPEADIPPRFGGSNTGGLSAVLKISKE